ncbi:UNVERIFIED_CONTAM: Dirigent protein 2 [Sesamum angustifolium]|uniref:Dirigent protein n=1 Tax=Sesamum angustifolium TaxID=2727405 RepID=A0AA51NHN6_9LAMI|nr:putative dirigent protein [Sesamum angustifolium]
MPPLSDAENPKPVDEWFHSLDQAKETRTKLHFYFQDVLGGESPTVWKVAESAITSTSATTFGKINMVDDLLTAGPEPCSEVVGRAQGTIGFADLHNTAIHMGLNIVFTEGKYKGSTISVVGRNPIFEKDRELPIVGGTGVFRMARGIAVSNTHSFDVNTNYGVLEYTLYITHYSL